MKMLKKIEKELAGIYRKRIERVPTDLRSYTEVFTTVFKIVERN
jgi:hypothetical protein